MVRVRIICVVGISMAATCERNLLVMASTNCKSSDSSADMMLSSLCDDDGRLIRI